MIFDLHNDFCTVLPDHGSEYAAKLASRGITCVAAVWTSEARDAAALVAGATNKLHGLCPIAIEDIGFLGVRERSLAEFDFSRYFYCSLTWNDNNALAGGAYGSGGLTERGRRAIMLMNKAGCVTDLAHLNRDSFWSALDASEHVLCSHTGFNNSPRSLTGEQIKAIIARGGIIGLSAVTSFTGAHTASELCTVIEEFVARYGSEHLAIGSDFFGTADLPRDMTDYVGLESLAQKLICRGMPAKTVRDIMYNNAQAFFADNPQSL